MAYKKNSRGDQVYSRTSKIRAQVDDEYDAYEGYDYDDYDDDDDDDASRRAAGKGCLIAFLVVFAIIVTVALVIFFNIKGEIDGKKATATETVTVDIGAGYGGTTIGRMLEENGLISNAQIFRIYTRLKGTSGFQEGRFYLEPGMSYDEMIEVMSQAPPARETIRVTFPEGSTVQQFAAICEKNGLCTAAEFIEEANNGDFSDIEFFSRLEQDPNTFMRAEGYLMPDTYEFYVDETAHNIVRKLFETFDARVSPLYDKMDELNISLRDTITLASMIEEEASSGSENAAVNQPLVSGVFWNRLDGDLSGTDVGRRTMGSDATFFYIRDWIARAYDDNLDAIPDEIFYGYYTADDDPQTREGLPIGPISSPGIDAINAALAPERVDPNSGQTNFYFLTDFYGNYYYSHDFAGHSYNISIMNQENAKYEEEMAASSSEEASSAA